MAQPVVASSGLEMPAGRARVVADVPSAFAALVAGAIAAKDAGPFLLGCSGGASGRACIEALVALEAVDLSLVEWFFADERCVDRSDPASNAGMLDAILRARDVATGPVHALSCVEGPDAYQELLESRPPLDVLQLGFGPDGHTASLFAGSAALHAPRRALVASNLDPSGHNLLPRLTLTLSGIARSRLVVIAVVGAEKADALARVLRGEPLPAALVRAPQLCWLIDEAAAAGLS